MDKISPALSDAFRLLRNELYGHLDEAELLADGCRWSEEDTQTARKLIPDLVTVIRGMLVCHENVASGQCRACGSAWPCPLVTTIHGLVKDPDRQFVELVRRSDRETGY